MADFFGWTGTILRVNLSNGEITRESTEPYKPYIGGMGIGYKVIFDEVPGKVKPYDPENKIVFAAGPLSGSGVPCSSRTNITSLLPSAKHELVSDSHMGGNFASMMKYAGYDAIIIEGKAPTPCWLYIVDDQVKIESAADLWGKGIYETTRIINSIAGKDASVAAIGQAGENLVNLSVIMNGFSHSAGGHGGVMGSKNLKAISLTGRHSIKMKGPGPEFVRLNKYMTDEIIGANNQHVVPSTPQPWAEFSNKASRWTAREGLTWGAATPVVQVGEAPVHDTNKVGYRTMKSTFDLGPIAEKYTVRMGGCQSCPIRCHSQLKLPQIKKYGVGETVGNTCMGYHSPKGVMVKGTADQFEPGDGPMIAAAVGSQLADDYGVWCNYGQIGRDLLYAYDHGILKEKLPAAEYNSIPWDLLENGDPAFLVDFYRRMAFKEGEFATLGEGAYPMAQKWGLGDEYFNDFKVGLFSPLGFPKHHSNEAGGQVGAIISTMFNRDAQSHTHMNLIGAGLPIEILKEVAGEIYGSPDALDPPAAYTPMNEYKAKFAKWSIGRNCLHDSLTLCNWMWPMTVSPAKERNYRGDTELEVKFLNHVTGEEMTEAELDLAGDRIFTLHRAQTIKQMNTIDMRGQHDLMTEWVYEADPEVKAFTEGTVKMDRDDMQLALTLFYKEMGWDEKSGAPTKETYEKLGMHDVAAQMQSLGLLP